MSFVATVTEITVLSPWQFVDVERPTVADSNHYVPITNVIAPVEANLSCYGSVCLGGVLSIHPSWCVRSTVMFRYWWSWHSISCSIREAVPLGGGGEVIAIAPECVATVWTRGTVCSAEFGVAWTLTWICKVKTWTIGYQKRSLNCTLDLMESALKAIKGSLLEPKHCGYVKAEMISSPLIPKGLLHQAPVF